MRHASRAVFVVVFLLSVSLVTACGHSNPVGPSTGSQASPGSGAVINGTVLGGLSSVRSAETTGDAMTVTVVGTNNTVTVSLTGQFTINGVPAGDVQLKFHGKNGDAILQLLQVLQGETVNITITITGTTATLETETRDSSGLQQVEGRIQAINKDARTLTVANKTILVTDTTTMRHGNTPYDFGELTVGWRVHVAGTPATGGVQASTIEVQNTNGEIQVVVNGIVSSRQGTASDFNFLVGTQLVKGDGNTDFPGKNGSFTALANGVRVEVKGQQQNGFVYAKSVKINP